MRPSLTGSKSISIGCWRAIAEALSHAIRRSCEVKAEIVGKDERERGDRALLNLGHTFGHAIESATGYGTWLHGEAVGAGMLMAAAMSRECGYLTDADVARLRALLHRVGLPIAAPDVSPAGGARAYEDRQESEGGAHALRAAEAHRCGARDGGLSARGAADHPDRLLRLIVPRRKRQASGLAPYAAAESESRGRRFAEPPPQFRGEYQRDRDRIIHSNAFRRLVYKTQVFVNHEGDLYRTRLTHSMEVAQIARSIAAALNLNETLAEAICLAHDLGHTPFGHAGQDALNACMRRFGGFEHNLQSLRVVDELEDRYADFHGLNLTFECREGILKHCSLRNARQLGELGERFIRRRQPSLEAQLSNFADEIAYNNHDVDDGLRAGLITLDDLSEVELFATPAPQGAGAVRRPALAQAHS